MAVAGCHPDWCWRHAVGAYRRPPERPSLMLNILKSWLSHLLRLIGWGVAGLSVLAVLLGARQAGRNAERSDQLKKIIEVKDAQLRAAGCSPYSR